MIIGIFALIVLIMLFFMYMGCRHELGLSVDCGQCEYSLTARYLTTAERHVVVCELEREHAGHKPISIQTWEIYR